MILLFSDWVLSKPQGGLLGYQYDNLTRELVVQGDLPEGWTWDILVSASGKGDTWPLALGDGQASITLTDDNLSVRGEYYLQLRGTNGDQVRHTNVITAYNSRSLSGAGQWPTLPTEWIQAEKDIKELNAHPPVPGSNGYWLLWDLSSHSYQESDLPVPVGPAGPPNVLEIGTVETLPADQQATASITGESPAQKLNLGIPQGHPGKDGPANTLEIGTVETLEPGQAATAQIIGEAPNQTLSLGIPRGQTGKTGATPALEMGQVETLEPGEPATAELSGTPEKPVLSLGIPQGPPGQDGQTPTITVGTVTTLDPGQDATAEITGETPNLTLNLGIPEGQPGQDGVQLNDDAINTTEAWSSKKIVDTLCPAFSVSGNPVVCNPVEDYPLNAVVSLEPKQTGTGDPSSENVRAISGYDSVEVNVRGKNVVDVDDIPNATISSSGHYFGKLLPFKPYLGATFTLSANVTCLTESYTDGWKLDLGAGNINYEYDIYNRGDYGKKQGARISVTGTVLREAAGYKNLAFRCRVQTPTPGVKFEITNIMLEVNDTPTPYEPYQPGTTATLTLPETIYGGTVDAVTGEGEKTWEFVELDGTEDWVAGANGDRKYFAWAFSRNPDDIPSSTNNVGMAKLVQKCSHFVIDNAYSADIENCIWVYSTPTANFPTIRLRSTANFTTVEELKSWLAAQASAGTPVQVAYKLATPEPFQATGNQALPAVAGLNTLYTDGDSLAVSGRQDLLHILQTMQAQTQNLNRFIAEGGTQ